MTELTSDKHYEEENVKIPMWEMIKKRAEEKDISYLQALLDIRVEFEKTISYADEEGMAKEALKRTNEIFQLLGREMQSGKFPADAD